MDDNENATVQAQEPSRECADMKVLLGEHSLRLTKILKNLDDQRTELNSISIHEMGLFEETPFDRHHAPGLMDLLERLLDRVTQNMSPWTRRLSTFAVYSPLPRFSQTTQLLQQRATQETSNPIDLSDSWNPRDRLIRHLFEHASFLRIALIAAARDLTSCKTILDRMTAYREQNALDRDYFIHCPKSRTDVADNIRELKYILVMVNDLLAIASELNNALLRQTRDP